METNRQTLAAALLMLLVISQQAGARPKGSLPVADLVQTEAIKDQPQEAVKLLDLTSDSLNEVGTSPPSLGSRRRSGLADDVTFFIPGGSRRNRPSFSVDSPSTDDVQLRFPGPPALSGASGQPGAIGNNDDVQFVFPNPSTSGQDQFSGPGLRVDLPVGPALDVDLSVDPNLKVDLSVDPILNVDLSATPNLDVDLPVNPDTIVDLLADPSLKVDIPLDSDKGGDFLGEAVAGGRDLSYSGSSNFGSGGNFDQFGGGGTGQFGGAASDKFGGSTQFTSGLDLGQAGGSSQFGEADFSQYGESLPDLFDPSSTQLGGSGSSQFGGGATSQFGGGDFSQFGGSASDQFGAKPPSQIGGGDLNQFGGGGSTNQFSSSIDQFSGSSNQYGASDISPLAPVPDVVVKIPEVEVNVASGNLGDGNQKVFNNRHSHGGLLSLFSPGQRPNHHTNHRGPSGNPLGDILSAVATPAKKIFNLFTLGLFDNNSQSNPLKELLAPLSLGLIGGEPQRGIGPLDLSIIGLGDDAIGDLVQVASSGLDDLARETSTGIKLAQDEVRFQAGEKVRQVVSNLQQTGRTLGVIGQNTYRSVLQKKDALAKLLVGVVSNLGKYINTSVGDTFEKVSDTAGVVGKFVNDLKVGLLNSMISKGENARELFSGTIDTVGTAFKDFTQAAQFAAEDNIRAITGLTEKKFR